MKVRGLGVGGAWSVLSALCEWWRADVPVQHHSASAGGTQLSLVVAGLCGVRQTELLLRVGFFFFFSFKK